MGVVAAELAVALLVSTAIRGWIGYRAWRLIHWLSYVSWPLAILHGLGTGSDMHAVWFQWLEGACVMAVWAALITWRLSFDAPRRIWPRLVVACLCSAAVMALLVWTLNGPLQPGWAGIAGTPPSMLKAAPTPTP
jgi:sulfoxide reductase heme-binding subunit YedZ